MVASAGQRYGHEKLMCAAFATLLQNNIDGGLASGWSQYFRILNKIVNSWCILLPFMALMPLIMLFSRKRFHLIISAVSLGVSLLGPGTGCAQIPALLAGQWEMRQISFVANQTVPPDILEQKDSPQVTELNQKQAGGSARLVVEFRPEGTHRFAVARQGPPPCSEARTYTVRGKTLLAQSPSTEGG